MLQCLEESTGSAPDAGALERAARANSAGRLPRIDGAERSPTGQAKCRSCREPIQRGAWRIRLVYFEEGRFLPGGFIHLECRKEYFEREDIADPVLYFSRDLGDAERLELTRALRARGGG